MAKTHTEKTQYKSKYSPQVYVTAAQYLIECLCENKARADKIGELPIKFWENKEWADFFKAQLRQVHKMFKKYGEIPVVRAVTVNRKGKNVYSLSAKWFLPIIEEEAAKYKVEMACVKNVEHDRIENPTTPIKKMNNKLLEDLD